MGWRQPGSSGNEGLGQSGQPSFSWVFLLAVQSLGIPSLPLAALGSLLTMQVTPGAVPVTLCIMAFSCPSPQSQGYGHAAPCLAQPFFSPKDTSFSLCLSPLIPSCRHRFY